MSIRYDEALPNLIRTARRFDLDLASEQTIVVRDSAGRLAIVFQTKKRSEGLGQCLQAALGRYAMLPEPLLSPLMFEALRLAGPIPVSIPVDGVYAELHMLDRRVVGMDWLSDFLAPPPPPPRLVFGSLKGGVGRSTALAVLAADLAHSGKRVLCIDLDLEAPGIGSMLLHEAPADLRPKYGVVDYLVENGLGGTDDDELFDHIGISQFGGGASHVLPAVGRVTDENPAEMLGKLGRALTEDVTDLGTRPLSAQIREMVDRFAERADYDAILVDSRAGLAESTASTWLGVGAQKLLLFGIDQPQTFHGYRYVLAHLLRTLRVPAAPESEDWRSRIGFVHAKAPMAAVGRQGFRERLHDLCAEMLYDQDTGAGSDLGFNFAFGEDGADVPHDATYVENHPGYEVFDPLSDPSTLAEGGYQGPFQDFLTRAWQLLGLERAR